MTRQNLTVIILGIILSVGLFIRVYRLTTVPPGIDWDEASYGYNSFSILTTGKDEWGKFLPLTFKAFGDSKQPLLVYLTVPFIALFGLNVYSIKMVSIVAGVTSVYLAYLIANKTFKNKPIAIITSFLVALSPYGIFYSRLGFDISLWSCLVLAGIYFELSYIENRKTQYWLYALFFLGLSFFSHNAAKILAPVLIALLSIVNGVFAKNTLKKMAPSIILLVTLLVILALQSKQSWNSRLQYVGIFGAGKSVALEIAEYRGHDFNNIVSRILHNKITFLSLRIYQNYISHFTLNYLTYSSKPNIVQMAFHSPLYLIQVPFYYYGLFLLFRHCLRRKKNKETLFMIVLLTWIISAPLPSSITEGDINKIYIGALGTWEILTAFGFWNFLLMLNKTYKKTIIPLLVMLVCCFFYFTEVKGYLKTYFEDIPTLYKHIYFDKQNKLGKIIARSYINYDRIAVSNKITGEPQIFALFFMRFPAKEYIRTKKWWQSNIGWIYVTQFGKTFFYDDINLSMIKQQIHKEKVLFIVTFEDLQRNLEYIKKQEIHINDELKYGDKFNKIYTFEIAYE